MRQSREAVGVRDSTTTMGSTRRFRKTAGGSRPTAHFIDLRRGDMRQRLMTEERRRERWLTLHRGLRVRRPRGRTVYTVVGRTSVPVRWGKMDVVELRRADGSTLTVGFPEAMRMEVVK